MTEGPMCQACLTAPVEQEIAETEGEPFRVCSACALRLQNLALRPIEWYRLAALHGPLTALLHDDFYDQDGRADQNRMPVEHATLFSAPTLRMVSANLASLLDYAMTRWHLDDAVVAALRMHPANAVLSSISDLAESRPTEWVESRCYEIAARVLGPVAGEWLASRWETGTTPRTLFAFLEAAASCLPRDDTVPRALEAVERASERDLSSWAMALAWFRSELVLDWMEERVRSPVSDRWGQLAACSGFTWSTATRWLAAGRPLSLVAIDALATIMRPNAPGRAPTLADLVGNMPDAPARSEILNRLREHALNDPVPRITQAIERIADDGAAA